MKKLVSNLIRLQELDTRLNELDLQRGDLPSIIDHLTSDLEEKQNVSNELQEKIDRLQTDRKMFEKEIEASKELLKKYEDQLYQVKNNKEYDAISLEIDTKKVEIENLESKIIQTLEDEEELKKEVEELAESIKGLNAQLDEHRVELEEINQHTKNEEGRLTGQRNEILQELDERHARQYERIRKANGGTAVASINRGSCGNCYSVLPPQRIVEVHRTDRLHFCEHCGVILVWTED